MTAFIAATMLAMGLTIVPSQGNALSYGPVADRLSGISNAAPAASSAGSFVSTFMASPIILAGVRNDPDGVGSKKKGKKKKGGGGGGGGPKTE